MKQLECPEILDLLVDYLEGDLEDEQRRHLEAHLEACPPCLAFLETYRQTGEICRKALVTKMPGDLKQSLHQFLAKKCRHAHDDSES